MASSINLGIPAFLDDAPLDAQTPFRTYEVGTRVQNIGTASANQVASGVFPGGGAMGVTAGSGLAVTVAAGYCCVANASALQGGYVFGTMVAQTLTLASADPASPRVDLIVARVYDTGTAASYCDVEVVTGTPGGGTPSTPSAALLLAAVQVNAGAASLTSSNIIDERTYVVAPGGVLPIISAASAPAVPASQLMYDIATGTIVQGTGTAGSVAALPVLPWAPVMSLAESNVTDSAAKGALTTVVTASCTVDGATDLEIYYKWAGFEASAAPLLVTVQVAIDSTTVDQTVLYPMSSSIFSCGGSARYFTSSGQGNTPSAGTHTVTFAFQSASSGATTTLHASGTAPGVLRLSPVAT